MARYIDADKMQEFIEEQNDINDWLVSQYNADWISSFIENQPTADVVEVVRCKDCKHWNEIEMECKNDYVVTDNEGGASFSLNFYLDDFCSYGKRRERNDL